VIATLRALRRDGAIGDENALRPSSTRRLQVPPMHYDESVHEPARPSEDEPVEVEAKIPTEEKPRRPIP